MGGGRCMRPKGGHHDDPKMSADIVYNHSAEVLVPSTSCSDSQLIIEDLQISQVDRRRCIVAGFLAEVARHKRLPV